MKYLTQSTTLMGMVTSVNTADTSFTLRCRSGDSFLIYVNSQTMFGVLTNLDELNRDRVPAPPNFNPGAGPSEMVRKYLHEDALVVVQGIYMEHEEERRVDARYVTLMHSNPGEYQFEETHWWLNQITRLGEEWLDDLFGDRRTYEMDDFAALYQTNLNILGHAGGRQRYPGVRHPLPPDLWALLCLSANRPGALPVGGQGGHQVSASDLPHAES